jgi:predicted kinase
MTQQTPRLIVVTGSPASGKTTIAKTLSESFQIPLITKDALKEDIYDTLEVAALTDSEDLDNPARKLMQTLAREFLSKGVSLILESNFKRSEAMERMEELFALSRPVLVQCMVPEDEAVDRYVERSEEGERHPVHEGAERAGELREEIKRGQYDLRDLDVPSVTVDTSGGDTDIEALAARIRVILEA